MDVIEPKVMPFDFKKRMYILYLQRNVKPISRFKNTLFLLTKELDLKSLP
jgi:hypothetical protein